MFALQATILFIGKANAMGHVYSREVAESIIRQIAERAPVLGQFGMPEGAEITAGLASGKRITHYVDHAFISPDGKKLIARIVINESIEGKELTKIIDKYVFRPIGRSEVGDDGNIKDYWLFAVHAVPILEDSFFKEYLSAETTDRPSAVVKLTTFLSKEELKKFAADSSVTLTDHLGKLGFDTKSGTIHTDEKETGKVFWQLQQDGEALPELPESEKPGSRREL